MPRTNVVCPIYPTIIRGGQEFILNANTPFQQGSSDTIVLRVRNANAASMDAMGSVVANGNGHVLDAAADWGWGSLNADTNYMQLPAQQEAAAVPLPTIGAGLVANVYMPVGTYTEIRYRITWRANDRLPSFTWQPENNTAGVPVFRVTPTPATPVAPAAGMLPPVAAPPAPTPPANP